MIENLFTNSASAPFELYRHIPKFLICILISLGNYKRIKVTLLFSTEQYIYFQIQNTKVQSNILSLT